MFLSLLFNLFILILKVLTFSCHVRSRDVRSVIVSNRSNQRWSLLPVIEGEFWTGSDMFVIEAQQNKAYEMVYRPLTMTNDGKKHQVWLEVLIVSKII